MTVQLTLNIKLKDETTFANFIAGSNTEAIKQLQNISEDAGEQCMFIWGKPGSGRTHLLQACCHKATQQNLSVIYLPLKQLPDLSPQILKDLERIKLVCLDDLENIVGDKLWEEAVFHTFNKLKAQNNRLVIAASAPPKNINFDLADLKSRLSATMITQIQMLNDTQKITALRIRAKARGLELSDQVCQYLFQHYSRDATSIFAFLDRLDQASLTSQRKITIPFVKKVLS